MKEDIKYLNLHAEFYTPEGCYITELSNTPDDPGLSIAQARVAPGVTTQWHRLRGITERYYIIQGKGLMEAGELPPREVNAGDVVLIPPLCRQRITNSGLNDLIFLAICTPRFCTKAYENIDSPVNVNDP
ncbi:MAG: cupin domain-containing protein [Smithellaceae bacterium]